MNRRDFLKKGALAVAGAIAGGAVVSGLAGTTGCTSSPKRKRIGLQLYSLRTAMRENPEATLIQVAEMGYTELETASYDKEGKIYGYTPKDFRTLVEGMGMKVTSCHTGQNWDPEKEEQIMAWWKKAFQDHKDLGCKYVIVPSIKLGETIESLDAVCKYFNRLAGMAKEYGLMFGYHNHAFEFKEIEGQKAYDYMLEHTDKDVVFEMDVYWAKEAGEDPVAYTNKYAGRFPLLHIKDDSIIGNSGKIDFEAIFAAAYAHGLQDFYVEVEEYELPPEVCVQKSFDYLDTASFVK